MTDQKPDIIQTAQADGCLPEKESMDLEFDFAQTRQFLKAMYGDYFSQNEGHFIEVRHKAEEGAMQTAFYSNPDVLLEAMPAWNLTHNYWPGMAPRSNNQGGKKEDVAAMIAIYADMDCGTEGHAKPSPYQTKEEALAALDQCPFKSSILVDSGGGLQPHWKLKEHVQPENGNLERFERVLKGFAKALKGDPLNAATILRMPGTYNMKLADNPRPVKMIHCHPEITYTLDELEQWVKPFIEQEHAPTGGNGQGSRLSGHEAYAQAALAAELTKLARSPHQGEGRNNQLNQSAYALGQLMGAGVLDRGSVEAGLYGVALTIGLTESETRSTIRSGIEAGMREPRKLPERERPQSTHRNEGNSPRQETPRSNGPHAGKEPPAPLRWPKEVMTGAAGRFAGSYANYLETPEPFLYMAYLTYLGHVISDRITLQSELTPEPRLFTILLGESAIVRKSTSISKTHRFFQEVISPDDLNTIWGVGSAEGLAKCFTKNKRAILILDELKSLIQKMRIDASVLLPCINTLFESKHYHNNTKKGGIAIDDAELCLLAASTLDTYSNMFNSTFTDIGFLNRLFVVIGDSQRKFPIPESMPQDTKEILKSDLKDVLSFVGEITKRRQYAMPINSTARDIFEEWYFHLEPSVFASRLDTYGHRLMPLLAVNEMLDLITPEIAEKTVTLLNYQLAARKYADPIDADNAIARLEGKIKRLLAGGTMPKRDLERRVNKGRVGIWAWDQAIKNLRNDGAIFWNSKTGEFGLNA